MKKIIFKTITKLCICAIILLITMIILKANPNFKSVFYKQVFEKNISFSSINSIYQKKFGKNIPFEDLFLKREQPVFNNKIDYSEANKYKDGVKLTVQNNYLVPTLDAGLVIFIGEKEEYGNTVIIQQANGIDVWYCNINNVSINMYDYIDKGNYLGEIMDNSLYLVFKKDGEALDYKKYL